MRRKFTRRYFFKINFQAGLFTFAGRNLHSGAVKNIDYKCLAKDLNSQNKICSVRKELYVPSPATGEGISVSMYYTGRGIRREEIRAVVRTSDLQEKPKRRISSDNGQNWSDWEVIDEKSKIQGDCTMVGGADQGGSGLFDPVSGRLIKPVFQRIIKGNPEVAMSEIWKGNRLFCDHGFYQLSTDNGL